MDPCLDYYLCTKDGETEMVAGFCADDVLTGYDSVQKLEFWQALQLTVGLWELERKADHSDLFPLATFMGASDELVDSLLDGGADW